MVILMLCGGRGFLRLSANQPVGQLDSNCCAVAQRIVD